jgi:AhpD family alkylhydroperoxidase
MIESQIELNDEERRQVEKLRELLPDLMAPERAVWDVAYKDGALSAKQKRLTALGIALGAGCTNCILAQTMRALEAGATKDEILETISVVVAMRGTTGIAESSRVLKLLEELGKL